MVARTSTLATSVTATSGICGSSTNEISIQVQSSACLSKCLHVQSNIQSPNGSAGNITTTAIQQPATQSSRHLNQLESPPGLATPGCSLNSLEPSGCSTVRHAAMLSSSSLAALRQLQGRSMGKGGKAA